MTNGYAKVIPIVIPALAHVALWSHEAIRPIPGMVDLEILQSVGSLIHIGDIDDQGPVNPHSQDTVAGGECGAGF